MSRDWIDWLLFSIQLVSLIGTVAAALLAYVTIRQAKRQARDAQAALIRERRLDFELDILKDLVLAVAVERVDALTVRGLALMLPATDIRLTRAAARLPATDDAVARINSLGLLPGGADAVARINSLGRPDGASSAIDLLKSVIAKELVDAIMTRVEERSHN